MLRNSKRGSRFNNRLKKLKSHDTQLIAQTSGKKIPGFRQLRFLFRFLNKKEARLFLVGIGIAVIGLSWYLGRYVVNNRVTIPDVGGEYSEVLVGTPRFINPIYAATNEVDNDLVRLVYSGLLRYDSQGNIQPDLAESYTASSTIYMVKLRQDALWHDGTQVTANDVLFTFERIQDPAVASPLRLSMQGVEIEKVDDHTISFTLEDPFAPFIHTLTTGILPQHVWIDTDANSMKLADANIRPIGSGPYKFSTLSKNKTGVIIDYTLEHNKDFYRGTPFIKTVQLHFAPDSTNAVESYLSKRVDGIHFVPQDKKADIDKRDTAIYPLQLPQYTALFFNQKRTAALEDSDVRQALAHSINRQQLIQDALKQDATAITSPLLPGMLGYKEDADFYAFSPTSSTALLDDSGYTTINREEFIDLRVEQLVDEWLDDKPEEEQDAEKESGELAKLALEQVEAEIPPSQDIFRKNKKDVILTVTITTVNNDATIATAELIQSFWQAIGVHTILYVVDPQLIQTEVIKNRNYEVLLFGEVLGADPDPYPFWHSSQIDDPGLNLSLFINRKADKLLEEARSTYNDEVREEAYHDFQEILHDELPAVFLYNPKYVYAQRTKINDFLVKRIVTPADRFNEIEKWFIETKGAWK